MQQEGWSKDTVQAALDAARAKDFSYRDGNILGSMCTAPHPLAAAAYDQFLETNLGDPQHFPGTANLEEEVLEDLARLYHAPGKARGRFLTGGTEANILALYLARETTGKRRVVLPEHAHFSFTKAARLLDMELEWVPSVDFVADVDAMADAIDDDTATVVGVAGSTELGLVDDIMGLAAVARDASIRLHVDAAFGGYILPFLDHPPAFDFQVQGVTTLGVDPHKMGMAPIPGGALFARDGRDWENIAVETPYVSTDRQATLMGTRPGAAAAACWAVHRSLGRDGFQATVGRAMNDARYLADGLRKAGFDLVAEPSLNVVTFRVDNPDATSAKLMDAGLRVNTIPRLGAIRIVVMPHVSRQALDRLLEAL